MKPSIIFFCLLAFVVQAQQAKIDSLEKWVASNPQKDTTWVNNLIDLERQYAKAKPEKKGTLAPLAIAQAKKLGYNKGISKGLWFLTYAYAEAGNYAKALPTALEKVAFEEKTNNDIELINAYNSLVYIYASTNNNPKALEYGLLASKTVESLPKNLPDRFVHYGNVNIGLANIYLQTKQNDKALGVFQQVVKTMSKAITQNQIDVFKGRYFEGVAYSNLASLYKNKKSYALAASSAEKALDLAQKHNIPLLMPPVLNTLAISYTNVGRYAEAEKYLAMVTDLHQQKQLQADETLTYFEAARDLSLKQNNFEKAYQFQNQHIALKDSIQGADVQNKLNDLSVKYETEKKEAQNQQLHKEKTAAEQQNQLYLVALGVFGLLLAIVGLLYRQLFQSRKIIADTNQELTAANQTKDNLFKVIAHDLKTPATAFVQLTQVIQQLVRKKDMNKLLVVGEQASLLANDLQSITNNLLYWAMLQQGKLNPIQEGVYLSDVFAELKEGFSTYASLQHIELHVEAPPQEAVVRANRITLITVLRNLLSNALKFTPENGQIRLESRADAAGICVLVEDSGKGFSVSDLVLIQANKTLPSSQGLRGEKGTGLGLMICQELLALNGSQLVVENSEALGGAKIKFYLKGNE